MNFEMPDVIYAGVVDGYEDHGFGGCCWGTGEKYISKQKAIDNPGCYYYSELIVDEFEELAKQIVDGNFNQANVIQKAKELINKKSGRNT